MPHTFPHVADISVEVGPIITVGETAEGVRRVIPILGGRITGPRLNGVILAAGADYQLVQADGTLTLEARYVIQLDDGAMVYVVNTGIRSGPPEVLARLGRGEIVDPSQVYFRTTPKFATGAKDHQWLTRSWFLGHGARHPDRVQITVFQVD